MLDAEGMLGTKRSKRYSAIVKDNVITHLNVEPDGSGALPFSSAVISEPTSLSTVTAFEVSASTFDSSRKHLSAIGV